MEESMNHLVDVLKWMGEQFKATLDYVLQSVYVVNLAWSVCIFYGLLSLFLIYKVSRSDRSIQPIIIFPAVIILGFMLLNCTLALFLNRIAGHEPILKNGAILIITFGSIIFAKAMLWRTTILQLQFVRICGIGLILIALSPILEIIVAPGDVIGGYVIGVLSGLGANLIYDLLKKVVAKY